MGKTLYPTGKPCKCGCGQTAKRLLKPDGSFSGWAKYAEGHQPPKSLCDPAIREKARKNRYANTPLFSRRIRKCGKRRYWDIKVPNSRRWVLEHRWLMSLAIGRELRTDEHVHHRDNNGLNNAFDNLELLSAADHMSMTNKSRNIAMCECTCPHCGTRTRHFRRTDPAKPDGA